MNLTVSDLLAQAFDTMRDPREAARRLMRWDIAVSTAWELLLLVVVVSTFVSVLAEAIGLAQPALVVGEAESSFTFQLGIINLVVLALSALLIHRIGRALGGTGSLAHSVLLVAWFQFVMLLLQLVQYLGLLLFPPLASLVGLAAMFMLFWLPTNFVATLHGFQSRWAVLLGLFFFSLILLFIVSLVLAMLGFDLRMEL